MKQNLLKAETSPQQPPREDFNSMTLGTKGPNQLCPQILDLLLAKKIYIYISDQKREKLTF